MKKMIFIVAFLCGIVCAEESCYTSTESGDPQICDMQGYVCKLGVDIGAQYNAMFFYLGTDSSCSNLFKSSKFTTTIMLNYIDENGVEHSVSKESPATKFFLVNDDNFAGPLSMTVAGSFALSAYNGSGRVHVIYRKVGDIEHGGVRILSISYIK